MPRRTSPTLTDAEARLMHVLWDLGAATVAEVIEALPGPARPAYNTVLTLLRILERKGYVSHEKSGRAFVFAPTVRRDEAQRSALRHLRVRLFGNSATALLLNLLGDEKIDRRERERLKQLVREA
jgi:predicted transcriptional regulator